MGLEYPGTFVPAQPSSHRHELVEKSGTETTSELSQELHVTQKPQLTIHASICFHEYHSFVDPSLLHLSPCFKVLAVASVPTSFQPSYSFPCREDRRCVQGQIQLPRTAQQVGRDHRDAKTQKVLRHTQEFSAQLLPNLGGV